jgi:hypothetical protein
MLPFEKTDPRRKNAKGIREVARQCHPWNKMMARRRQGISDNVVRMAGETRSASDYCNLEDNCKITISASATPLAMRSERGSGCSRGRRPESSGLDEAVYRAWPLTHRKNAKGVREGSRAPWPVFKCSQMERTRGWVPRGGAEIAEELNQGREPRGARGDAEIAEKDETRFSTVQRQAKMLPLPSSASAASPRCNIEVRFHIIITASQPLGGGGRRSDRASGAPYENPRSRTGFRRTDNAAWV